MHRDIKPENILVAPSGHLAIADFGLSWPHEDTDVTKCSMFDMTGTPGYWAPEVATVGDHNPWPYSYTADIWSLGMTIFEMVIRAKSPWYAQGATISKTHIADVLRSMMLVDVPYHLAPDRDLGDLIQQARSQSKL